MGDMLERRLLCLVLDEWCEVESWARARSRRPSGPGQELGFYSESNGKPFFSLSF